MVTADEVNNLAEEPRTHTEEITDQIIRLQNQTATTVTAVEGTEDELDATSEKITDAMTSFRETAEQINETARGIADIAEANDQQAKHVVVSLTEEARDQAMAVQTDSADIDDIAEELLTVATQLRKNVERLSTNAEDD